VQGKKMSDTNNQDTKVTFDENQQKKVNDLVTEAQGRAAKEVRAELEKEKASAQELKNQLEDTKKEFEKLSKKNKKTEGEEEDVEALRANLAEQKRILEQSHNTIEHYKTVVVSEKDKTIGNLKNELDNVRKQTALAGAAATIGFVDVSDVLELTKESVTWDENRGRYIVKGEAGQPRLNNALEPMTLNEFYQEYAYKKPFLVRSDARSGTGGVETKAGSASSMIKIEDIFGPKSSMVAASKLMKEDPARYRELRKVAEVANLIAPKI